MARALPAPHSPTSKEKRTGVFPRPVSLALSPKLGVHGLFLRPRAPSPTGPSGELSAACPRVFSSCSVVENESLPVSSLVPLMASRESCSRDLSKRRSQPCRCPSENASVAVSYLKFSLSDFFPSKIVFDIIKLTYYDQKFKQH